MCPEKRQSNKTFAFISNRNIWFDLFFFFLFSFSCLSSKRWPLYSRRTAANTPRVNLTTPLPQQISLNRIYARANMKSMDECVRVYVCALPSLFWGAETMKFPRYKLVIRGCVCGLYSIYRAIIISILNTNVMAVQYDFGFHCNNSNRNSFLFIGFHSLTWVEKTSMACCDGFYWNLCRFAIDYRTQNQVFN